MRTMDAMTVADCLLAVQLLSDHAPPVSSVLQTETSLLFTWNGRDDRLHVEITLEHRAHWEYTNRRTRETRHVDHDADEGWPPNAKRLLMRFNRRAA